MEEDPGIEAARAVRRSLIEQKMHSPLNRREFVQRVGGGLFLSTVGASLLEAGGGGGGNVGGTLNMVIWDGYDDKEAFGPFIKEHNVTTHPTYIGNNEEIFTK